MRETRADTARAVGLTVLLHLVPVAVWLIGWLIALLWPRPMATASAGSPVEAEMVAASDLSAAMRRTLRDRPDPIPDPLPEPEPEDADPLPQPEPEPSPQDSPTPQQNTAQDFIPVPDQESQEAVVDQATPLPATTTTPQPEKKRQEQVDLSQLERQQQAEARRRLAEMNASLERDKQLADIRRRRAEAARQAEMAEARLQQLADARATQASRSTPAQAGNNGTDTGLAARYRDALTRAILSKWVRPDNVALGARCKLIIRQLPGGEVADGGVEFSSPCAYDEAGRKSIEAAVLKAQPLPFAGFEPVFQRTLILNFEAQER
ncbi:cell envelope integrity protein TolA [Montanilutibacter psychrotolerans]|uniref:Protein TolA n=1 Tax=Montanilutibacter psychrotolerans TaxID=1327343 RepID=A0A3M8SSD5_9GAMM|nr:cell envelope integrity protein TolA [Lysobacter psychrotolerans]RNF84219.1 protein TolA [Lysobacter psychrotolerans]